MSNNVKALMDLHVTEAGFYSVFVSVIHRVLAH
jgi:hypothetical protein